MDKLNLKKSEEMWQDALDLVPGGVLGIKETLQFHSRRISPLSRKGRPGMSGRRRQRVHRSPLRIRADNFRALRA